MSIWFKGATEIAIDDKLVRVGPAGFQLYIKGIAYSMMMGLDGVVPKACLPILMLGCEGWLREDVTCDMLCMSLVTEKLWEKCPEGFRIPYAKWCKHQKTKDQMDEEKQKAAERQRKSRENRKQVQTEPKRHEVVTEMSHVTETLCHSERHASVTQQNRKEENRIDKTTEQSSSLRSEEITEDSLRSSSVSPKSQNLIPDEEFTDDPHALWLLGEMRKKVKWRPGIDPAKVAAKVDQWRSECDGDMDWLREELEQALGHVAASKNTAGLSYLANWIRKSQRGKQGPKNGNSQIGRGGKPCVLAPYQEAMRLMQEEKKHKMELCEAAI